MAIFKNYFLFFTIKNNDFIDNLPNSLKSTLNLSVKNNDKTILFPPIFFIFGKFSYFDYYCTFYFKYVMEKYFYVNIALIKYADNFLLTLYSKATAQAIFEFLKANFDFSILKEFENIQETQNYDDNCIFGNNYITLFSSICKN